MMWVECPFHFLCALASGVNCGVVMYSKFRRAKSSTWKFTLKLTQKTHKSLLDIPYNHQTLHPPLCLQGQWPCTVIQHIPIDSERAETLGGLRRNIPNKWCPRFHDGGLNRGQITAINLDASSFLYFFQFELDDEPGVHYTMRYNSYPLHGRGTTRLLSILSAFMLSGQSVCWGSVSATTQNPWVGGWWWLHQQEGWCCWWVMILA